MILLRIMSPKIKIGSKPFMYPLPVTIISVLVKGKPNFMPASFVGMMNYNPPIIATGLSENHFTVKGIYENKSFGVNIPSVDQMVATDYCGLKSGEKVDKSKVFKVFYGDLKNTPLIEECPVSLECELRNSIPLGNDTLFLGNIKEIYCDKTVLTEGNIDLHKVNPMLFTMPDNKFWSIGKHIGYGWKSGINYKP